MKTTIKLRIQRLVLISVGICGVVIGAAGLGGSYSMANADGKKLGRYVTDSCSATLAEEFTYISDSLDSAQPSPDGDYTFDRVTMYGEDGYDLAGAQNELNAAQNGDMAFTPPVLNEAGDRVILAAKGREDGVVLGELNYDYFVAILDTMRREDGDVGYIFSANGDLILSTDYETTNPGVNAADDLGFGDIMQQLYAGNSGSITARNPLAAGSDRMMFTYSPVADTGMYVVYGTKAGALFSTFYSMLTFVIVIMAAEFVGASFVGIRCAVKISSSITGTTDRLVQLSNGDVHTAFEPNQRGDETQVLSEAMAVTIDRLSSYITDISEVLEKLSNGDLTAASGIEYAGDFTGIRDSLDKITRELSSTMQDIRTAGDQVLEGADIMSDGAQNLASNSQDEVSALTQISAEAEEMQNRISATAKSAAEAETLLKKMMGGSAAASSTMTEMTTAMEEIRQSSEEIKKIVTMIDDIAFQTNILALNAAIEAARAGEAGKGFAVVADEVGNLAGKSAQAAQNTMELVAKSSSAVERGAELTVDTEKSLNEISSYIDGFGGLISSITEDSSDENSSISQINAGLERITNAVQSNSATAENSAGTAEELRSQAATLHSRLEMFRFD